MKKYVILDIDRTIINGTSWYHACSCPNLLIDEYNIDRFKELNNKMYVHGTSKDRYEFRKQTFELINKRVSESAYRKLSECGCADEILIGQNVNEVFFEAVGIYTYKKLMKSDEDCKKIVDFIYKYYFGDIEFIFLTSGYEPFMKGLVKEYMKSFHKNCTWRTIGSTIKFSNGCIYLKEVMTQEKKFQFVKKIIDYGNRVVFLADDSVEEKELFSVVFRNGGYAFNVRYDEKLHESNWHELINDIEDENVFLSYLMKNSEVALSDCKKVQNNFFRLHMNEIGVICLNDIEYQIFLGSFNRDKKIVEYIKKVSHKKEEKYYLRGRYYYYWLKIKFYNNHFTKKIDNKKGMNIYNQNGQEYLIVERDYIYDLKLSDSLKDDYTSKVISDGNHQCSFIVDFNGIDNFIASKSLIFNDYDVRELVIKHLNLVEGKFKRFGASGSRPSEKHPGGEVVELQTIDVKNKTGCAGSVSGYLDMSNNEYGKAISLSEDGLTLREERTVYSHTIWIPENSKPIIVRVQSNIKGLSLLSVILEECKKMKIHACGISVAIDGMKTLGIKGRVLKNIPIQPFKELQEATDIAVEKEFLMPKCSTFLMYGTLYNRFEPEWREFTKGRQYEKRGHYHAKINGDYLENVHEVFHVRDVFLNKEQCVEISIYPASKTYRIIPITKKGNEYITCSFEKNINKYVENYCNYDYYL